MAVLAEAISVIVRLDAIARVMEDDWSRFVEIVPNRTLCCDNELARVGIMSPQDVEAFVRVLEGRGFQYRDPEGAAVDLVVVDQMRGPAVPCEWIEWGTIRMNTAGEKVTVCRRNDGKEQQLYTPEGWTFEGSLSQRFGFVEAGAPDERYRFVRTEDGIDVYFDTATRREVYVGRTKA
jgi:hypothetical protein